MQRRTYLALATLALAGCTSSGDDAGAGTTDTDTSTATDTATPTPTETTTTPPPAEFEFVSFDAPASIETGEEVQVAFTVRNVGGQDGTLETQVQIEKADTDEIVQGAVTALNVDAGESATWESDEISVEEETTLNLVLPEFDAQSEIAVEPWRNEDAQEDLDQVEQLLTDAVEAYVSHLAPMRDLTELSADISVNVSEVRSPLYDARDLLNDLDDAELGDQQQQQLNVSWGTFWFVWWLASTHDTLNSAYSTVSSVWGRTLNESYYNARSSIERISDDISAVENELEKLTQDSDASDMTAFDRLSSDDYEAKLSQIRTALDQFQMLGQIFGDYINGLETFTSAIDDYESQAYQSASAGFYDVSTTFEDLVTDLDGTEWADSLSGMVNSAACIADAMAAGSADLDTAAQAGADGNDERQQSAEENARTDFESCDLVMQEIDAVADFYA